jgi:hypothetical protein
LAVGCADVEWAVPATAIRSESDWIYSWARDTSRTPDAVLSSWEWLDPWMKNVEAQVTTIVQPLAIGVVCLLGAAALKGRRGVAPSPGSAWLLAVPPALSLTAWFFTAPDPRFAQGLFWALQMAGVAVLVAVAGPATRLARGLAVLALLLISTRTAAGMGAHPQPMKEVLQSGIQPIPTAQLSWETTLHGLQVLVPEVGDRSNWSTGAYGLSSLSPTWPSLLRGSQYRRSVEGGLRRGTRYNSRSRPSVWELHQARNCRATRMAHDHGYAPRFSH